MRSLVACVCLVASVAYGQPPASNYPSKPLRVVLGFTPGSVIDVMTRLITPKLGEVLGQPVIVENKPGAGSNIGTELVARAPPDGYTLLMGGIVNTINASLVPNLPFDFARDITPVVQIGRASCRERVCLAV